MLHWLYGNGKDLNYDNDKSWNEYMMANGILTNSISDLVKEYAAEVKPGETKEFDITTSMEIENGEQMIGYQYLHGTNADEGGFKITGTITKDTQGNANISFTYQWNDRIDPNFIYDTDSKKAEFAKGIPFANPTDYAISISWSDESTLDKDGNFTSGWLQSSKNGIETPLPPNDGERG